MNLESLLGDVFLPLRAAPLRREFQLRGRAPHPGSRTCPNRVPSLQSPVSATLLADCRPEVVHADRGGDDSESEDGDAGAAAPAWRRTAIAKAGSGDARDAAVTATLAAGSYIPLHVARAIAAHDECVEFGLDGGIVAVVHRAYVRTLTRRARPAPSLQPQAPARSVRRL